MRFGLGLVVVNDSRIRIYGLLIGLGWVVVNVVNVSSIHIYGV